MYLNTKNIIGYKILGLPHWTALELEENLKVSSKDTKCFSIVTIDNNIIGDPSIKILGNKLYLEQTIHLEVPKNIDVYKCIYKTESLYLIEYNEEIYEVVYKNASWYFKAKMRSF